VTHPTAPDPVEALLHLGGVATRSQLLTVCSRSGLERAVREGTVLRRARDRYTLPSLDDAIGVAHAVSGVLCLTSAALYHGWAVKEVPEKPHVSFRRNRKLTAAQRDARRYDLLVVDGWIVLRFAWEDVMFDQDFVRSVLLAAVDLAGRRTKVPYSRCGAA
jgi:hypothetical protein